MRELPPPLDSWDVEETINRRGHTVLTARRLGEDGTPTRDPINNKAIFVAVEGATRISREKFIDALKTAMLDEEVRLAGYRSPIEQGMWVAERLSHFAAIGRSVRPSNVTRLWDETNRRWVDAVVIEAVTGPLEIKGFPEPGKQIVAPAMAPTPGSVPAQPFMKRVSKWMNGER